MVETTPLFEVNMEQGAEFTTTVNWYGGGAFRAAIEEITPGYPTIIRVSSHLLPTASDTPVIISGVDGLRILNSTDAGIELVTRIDDDEFSVPLSTVNQEWELGTGEITWYKPTDITDFTARCTLRSKWYSGTVIHTFTTENGGITLNANDGSIQLDATNVETADMSFVKAYGDVELISSGGLVTRVFRLAVQFSRETTT